MIGFTLNILNEYGVIIWSSKHELLLSYKGRDETAQGKNDLI